MTTPLSNEAERRRALRQQLREAARLLRRVGYALLLLGGGGLATGLPGEWWVFPSWFSLVLGLGLIVCGTVSRVRNERPPPGLTGG